MTFLVWVYISQDFCTVARPWHLEALPKRWKPLQNIIKIIIFQMCKYSLYFLRSITNYFSKKSGWSIKCWSCMWWIWYSSRFPHMIEFQFSKYDIVLVFHKYCSSSFPGPVPGSISGMASGIYSNLLAFFWPGIRGYDRSNYRYNLMMLIRRFGQCYVTFMSEARWNIILFLVTRK